MTCGLDQSRYLNLRDRVKSLGASLAGISVYSLLYTYDAVGNVTQRVDNVNGALNLFGNWRATNGQVIPEHMVDMEPPYPAGP